MPTRPRGAIWRSFSSGSCRRTPLISSTRRKARDDSTSHIRTVLTRTSEVIPIADGRMQLGTWQGIFLFEHRRAPHRREIALTSLADYRH